MAEGKQYFCASEALLAHIKAAFHASAPRILLGEDGRLRVEALFSSPRIDVDLYGLAHAAGAPVGPSASPVRVWSEELLVTAIWYGGSHGPDVAQGNDQGILMYALSLTIYTLPAHRSAVVYVSKLDTTGYAPPSLSQWDNDSLPRGAYRVVVDEWARQGNTGPAEPTTITKLLTESVLSYFMQLGHWRLPSTPEGNPFYAVDHVSLHVLARAQHAYLFPWSDKGQRKHILTDKQLIRWWRDVLSRVTLASRPSIDQSTGSAIKAFYMIPGYSTLESTDVVSLPPTKADDKTPLAQAQWSYGHPYTSVWPQENGNHLPLHHPSVPQALRLPYRKGNQPTSVEEATRSEPSIASLVPTFDDDPKGRFLSELVEIVYDQSHGIKVGRKRRIQTTIENETSKKPKTESELDGPQAEPTNQHLGRQGAHAYGNRDAASYTTAVSLSAGQKEAWKERSELDKVSAAEFWERMGFRQECNSGNAVGVFVILVQRPALTEPSNTGLPAIWRTAVGALPGKMLHDLVIRLLLLDKNDWSTPDSAAELTTKWIQTTGTMIRRKGEAPRSLRFPSASDSERVGTVEENETNALDKFTFAIIPFSTPPADVLTKAKARYEQMQQGQRLDLTPAKNASAPRTLTVKRKKKPAA